jgi:dihydroorotase-like cyclic amidohydrolase
LTQQKTFDLLAARGFVSTGEDFLTRESFDKNSVAWMKTFRASGKAGVVSMLHAEDWSIMAEAQERLMTDNGGGGGTLHNFAQSAPIVAEVLAVQRGVAIAEATGSPIYILHVSSGRALKVMKTRSVADFRSTRKHAQFIFMRPPKSIRNQMLASESAVHRCATNGIRTCSGTASGEG